MELERDAFPHRRSIPPIINHVVCNYVGSGSVGVAYLWSFSAATSLRVVHLFLLNQASYLFFFFFSLSFSSLTFYTGTRMIYTRKTRVLPLLFDSLPPLHAIFHSTERSMSEIPVFTLVGEP